MEHTLNNMEIANQCNDLKPPSGSLKKKRLNESLPKNLGHLVVSRLAILAIILLTQATADVARGNAGQYINLNGTTKIQDAIRPSDNLLKADIGWYKKIADSGYTKQRFQADGNPESQRNWAFFPGWPLAWKLGSLGKTKAAAGLMLANGLFIVGMIAMDEYLTKSNMGGRSITESFFLLASYYPFGYFFSLPLPESLFSACTAFFLLSIPKDTSTKQGIVVNWIAGYASGLTRPTGIFNSIFPVFQICKYIIQKDLRPRLFAGLIASSLSPFLGLGTFMLHLHQQTGNPLAFKDIQVAWGRSSGIFFEGLAKAVSPSEIATLTHYSNFRLANLFACLLMIACILLLTKRALHTHKKGDFNQSIDIAGISLYLLLLAISCSSDNQQLLSFSRIAGTNPVFLAALALCLKPQLVKQITPVLAIFFGAFCALAVVGFDAFAA